MEIQLFLELGGTFLTGALTYLFMEASKYFGAAFDWSLFYNKNVKPMKWTGIGSVAFMLIYAFIPQLMPFVEVQAGGEVDVTSYEGIILGGGVVGGLLKSIFLRKERKAAKE